MGGVSAESLIVSLSTQIDEVLRRAIPAISNCALLGFPNHWNVGDSAIWLGQRAALARAGVRVTYVSDERTFSPHALRRRLPNGFVLLSGGGTLGDLWSTAQRFREEVITSLPDYRIVQLPQSIYFRSRSNLARARQVFERHGRITLLVRDRQSLEVARSEFRVPSLLCPDMALALGPLARAGAPCRDVVWLKRNDIESRFALSDTGDSDVERTGWTTGLRSRPPRFLRRIRGRLGRFLRGWPDVAMPMAGVADEHARRRVERGRRVLSRGRVVITDRLHGHILCLLLGIPHVLLDNSYGKVRSFHETWTRGCDLVHFATSPAAALARARSLIAIDPDLGARRKV